MRPFTIVDDSVSCCRNGDVRACGSNIGACVKGQQTCVNGFWGECTGGSQPVEEICFNGKDDNCDGQMDEGCSIEETCYNGVRDANEDGIDCGDACNNTCGIPLGWMLIGAGIIIVIVVMLFLVLTGQIKFSSA